MIEDHPRRVTAVERLGIVPTLQQPDTAAETQISLKLRGQIGSGGYPMDFSVGRPDVVRAVNQRWLLKFWKAHLGCHRVPQWQSVDVEKLSAFSANLSLLVVKGGSDGKRFMVRFNGTVIGNAYGSGDYRGKCLDEIIPPAFQHESLVPFMQTARDGCPIYTIQDLKDRNGHLVHYERLLLPFAGDGQNVDRILASAEFVSLEGAFDGHNIMRTQASPPILQLAAKIDVRPL